jgi:hypothetical protein
LESDVFQHRSTFPRRRVTSIAFSIVLVGTTLAHTASPATQPTPFLTLEGEVAGDQFGASVAANGDPNGDGFADIVVGAQWNDADAPNAGRAYLYWGGPGADAVTDVILRPDVVQSRALTGYAVAILGDVDGDGIDDVAVGSPVSRLAGRVFVYAGGPSMDGIPDRVLGGLKSLEFFGAAVTGVGDMNGDGIRDILVGAPWFVPLFTSATRVGRGYLFFGKAGGGGVVDVLIEGRPIAGFQDELQFATSVAAAGDVNGDGYADLLVGQPADGTFVAGRAFVYYGGFFVHRFPDIAFLPDAFRYRAGHSVTLAGDFNGDGRDDYVVGAPDSGENGTLTGGRAYLYFGGQSTPEEVAAADMIFVESSAFDAFGTVVASGADVSGDGWPDLLVGAPQSEGAAGIRAGKVYVYYGGPLADTVADVVLEGDREDAAFGSSIGLGDVNGDGVADAIIGAPGTLGVVSNPGHVHAFDLVVPLPARAFAHDSHRALPLAEPGPPYCLQVEPIGNSFAIENVDPATIRLHATEAGADLSVGSRAAKRVVQGDRDGNGVPEFEACFEREALRRLFPSLRGRRNVAATLTGALVSGRSLRADVALVVVGTGAPSADAASVAPNPVRPAATLSFRLPRAGFADVSLYDVSGRKVRTLAGGIWMTEGEQRLPIDGHDDDGRALASGVYFYRILSAGAESRGRFVIAK